MKRKLNSSGFESPNFTQVPNDLFDMLSGMSNNELRVTLVMIRQTFGYHRESFKMGMGKISKAAGISYNSVVSGVTQAEKRGTFRRVNPSEITEAEWELVVHPSNPEGYTPQDLRDTPQDLRDTPSNLEGQVGLNKELNKENKGNENQKPRRTDATPKGDLIDGMKDFAKSAGMAKSNLKDDILSTFEVRLRYSLTGRDAETFVDFIAKEEKAGRHYSKFIDWWIANGGQRQYWTIAKMRQNWLAAFGDVQPEQATIREPEPEIIPVAPPASIRKRIKAL